MLSAELSTLVKAALVMALLGVFLGNWLVAGLVALGGYVLWLFHRLGRLENWVRRGTKVSQVYDDDGFIGNIIRQLYQQKMNHNKRKKRTKAILGSLNRNISALPDATVLLNADLEIDWCNEPARYLLSIRSPQDLGHRITNLIRMPEFHDYLQNHKAEDFVEIQSPSDQQITVQIKLVSIGDGKKLLIARNISDQKKLQESLKNFVANASHELKSPLTVISGHLEMLEDEDGLSSSGVASLRTAQRQTTRMHDLIQSLLLLSQVESYQLRPGDGERIPIVELMTNVNATMDKFGDRNRIEWDYPSEFYLLGVKAEIEGICINLVENALKYSTPGTPIRVEWKENSHGEYVFSVTDQGPGIEETEISRLTERYYRSPRYSADITGSGLGLAIVEQAAIKHGACLQIDSKPGQSSTFSVNFPSYRCIHDQPAAARVFRLADY